MNIAARLGYLVAVVTGLVLLLIMHRPPAWFPLIAEEYAGIRWTIDLALGAVICAYTWLMFDDPAWLKHFARSVLNILFLLAIYSLYRVFPFRYGAFFWEQLTRIVLLLAAAAAAVGLILDMSRLLISQETDPEKQKQDRGHNT